MVRLPFGFNSSFGVFAILAVGYLLKDHRFLLDKYTGYKRLLIAITFIFLLVLFSDINGNTNLDYVKYNNVYLFVLYSTIGVVAVLLISKSIGSNRVLNYIGVNSLPLFAFSEPVKRSVIGVVSKVSQYPIDQIRSS